MNAAAAMLDSTLVDERTMERLVARHIMDIDLPIGGKRGKRAKDRLSRLARAIASEAYGDQPEFEENRERASIVGRLDTLAADITAIADAVRGGPDASTRSTRVIVEVSGGVVQAVYASCATDRIDVDVLDWDNYNGEDDDADRTWYHDLESETKSDLMAAVY